MRPFASVFLIFFFVACSSSKVDSGDIDISENLNYDNSYSRFYTYDDLYQLLRNRGPLNPHSVKSRKYLLDILRARYEIEEWNSHYTKLVEQLILKFTLVLQRFWTKSSRNHIRFIQANSEWLKCELKLPTQEQNKTIGRPIKDFENSCERSKRNKIKTIINTISSSEMIQATQTSLHSSGNRIAANLLKESIKTPTRALKIKKAYDNSLNVIIPYTNDEALAFFLDNNLTKQQYSTIHYKKKC